MKIVGERGSVRRVGGCALMLALLTLGACRSPLPDDFATPPGNAWEIRGRLILEDAQNKRALTFNWRWRDAWSSFQCSDLLGRRLFHIYSASDGSVMFTGRDGTTRRAENEDALMRRLLGRAVPVRLLRHWIRGQAASEVPVQASARASDGRLERLQQAGWSLQFAQHQQRGKRMLPTVVRAQRGDLRLHLRIWNWKTPDFTD